MCKSLYATVEALQTKSSTEIDLFPLQIDFIKRPARDACLCMGDLQAPAAPPAPHFVFLITL